MTQTDVRTRSDAVTRIDARSIAERLSAVEARVRRMRWGGAVVLLVVAAALLAVRLNPGGVVVARSFIVVDDDGRTRAILSAHDDAPSLTMMDAAGVGRAAFADNGVVLADANNRARARFQLPSDAAAPPHVKLEGDDGTILLRPGGAAGGGSGGATATAPSTTGLVLTRPADRSGATLALPAGGGPGIEFTDLATRSRTLFTLSPDGSPRLVLLDKDGRETFAAP